MKGGLLLMGGLSPWSILILLFLSLIIFFIFSPIAKKAGYSRWWALLMLIPIVSLIVIWVFAFVTWPNEKSKKI